MGRDWQAEADEFIVTMPREFDRFSADDLDRLANFHRALGTEQHVALAEFRRWGRTAGDRPMAEALSETDYAAFEAVTKRLMAMERAEAALAAWEEQIGLPVPSPSEPIFREGRDGTISARTT